MSIFSERMKEIRLKKDMSQRELGDRLGIQKQRITEYENSAKVPSIIKAHAIADVLGVSLDWLCGRTDKEDSYKL